jgi:hypothetical protein
LAGLLLALLLSFAAQKEQEEKVAKRKWGKRGQQSRAQCSSPNEWSGEWMDVEHLTKKVPNRRFSPIFFSSSLYFNFVGCCRIEGREKEKLFSRPSLFLPVLLASFQTSMVGGPVNDR